MFSIARYQGDNDDDQLDQRTLETKKERLNSLLNKVNKKRKKSSDIQDQKNENDIQLEENSTFINENTEKEDTNIEPKNKKKKQKKKKNDSSQPTTTTEINNINRERSSSIDLSTDKDLHAKKLYNQNNDTIENEDIDMKEKNDIQDGDNNQHEKEKDDNGEEEEEEEEDKGLEEFPDIVTNNKHSEEDLQLLRNMGIPDWLLQPTVISPDQTCSLSDVGLSSRLVQRCEDLGLSSFFAVQMSVIPVFLRRQTLYDTRRAPGDLCISAPTGSGKTMAYVLPIVDILSKRVVTRLRALIILPTRDLVIQVKETFDAFVKGTDLKVGVALGQHSFAHEQSTLVGELDERYTGGKSKVDILIATPGRLMDHMKDTPNFTLQHLRFLVIDEADRLLNQSYQDWLNHILQATKPQTNMDKSKLTFKTDKYNVVESDGVSPSFMTSYFNLPNSDLDLPKAPCVQKLLFSATLTKNPGKIAGLHLTDPEYISVQRQQQQGDQPEYTTPAGLKEYMMICTSDKKPLLLIYLIHQLKIKSGLCFTKSVESARRLQLLLSAYAKQQDISFNIVEYSSDLNATQRKTMLKQFKDGQIDLMICSDLIGRGIDLDCVQVVISYDIPLFMDKYIHRVGRTARAGREGKAFTLVETQEARYFKEMLKKSGHYQQVESFSADKNQLSSFEKGYQQALQSLS